MNQSVLRRGARAATAAVLAVFLGACNLDISNRAQARDHWQRSYPLASGGSFEVKNTNGRITITPSDGKTIEVDAERIVGASSDEAAKAALAQMKIVETIEPARVALDATPSGMGLTLNLSRRVDFTIKLPAWANVTLRSTNGDISVERIAGNFTADTTNGRIRASGLEGGATVEATNGAITLEFAKLGDQGVRVETTNGAITVLVPRDANGRLTARVTNGSIDTGDLPLKVIEQSRRRLDATLGTGGPELRLETTNGLVSVKAR